MFYSPAAIRILCPLISSNINPLISKTKKIAPSKRWPAQEFGSENECHGQTIEARNPG